MLVTDDRDFGDIVFRLRQPHAGVLYFRLPPTGIATKINRLSHVLTGYADALDQFVVITMQRVRIRRE